MKSNRRRKNGKILRIDSPGKVAGAFIFSLGPGRGQSETTITKVTSAKVNCNLNPAARNADPAHCSPTTNILKGRAKRPRNDGLDTWSIA